MTEGLGEAIDKLGVIYNPSDLNGKLPPEAITDINENGAGLIIVHQAITFSYFQDPERLGLPNVHVSVTEHVKMKWVHIWHFSDSSKVIHGRLHGYVGAI